MGKTRQLPPTLTLVLGGNQGGGGVTSTRVPPNCHNGGGGLGCAISCAVYHERPAYLQYILLPTKYQLISFVDTHSYLKAQL